MPIRWSAVRVNDAVDMIEEYVNQAAEPLESAKIVAQEATQIVNVPGYITDCLWRLIGEIERAIGGGRFEEVGRLRANLKTIRERIPEGATEAEKALARHGRQPTLV